MKKNLFLIFLFLELTVRHMHIIYLNFRDTLQDKMRTFFVIKGITCGVSKFQKIPINHSLGQTKTPSRIHTLFSYKN